MLCYYLFVNIINNYPEYKTCPANKYVTFIMYPSCHLHIHDYSFFHVGLLDRVWAE